jgi:hypothetical protein
MFTRHRLGPTNKLDCPHAVGANAFSPQRAESFRHFLLLPSPSVVYHGRQPTNLRVSLGARAAQLQASGLRVRSHAGACSPPAQRTTTGYAGRCAEVVEARSSAAFDGRCESFLAKEVLRFQRSKLPAVLWKSCAIFIAIRSSAGCASVRRTGSGAAFATTQPAVRDGSKSSQNGRH